MGYSEGVGEYGGEGEGEAERVSVLRVRVK